jgi:hypothetical protein
MRRVLLSCVMLEVYRRNRRGELSFVLESTPRGNS